MPLSFHIVLFSSQVLWFHWLSLVLNPAVPPVSNNNSDVLCLQTCCCSYLCSVCVCSLARATGPVVSLGCVRSLVCCGYSVNTCGLNALFVCSAVCFCPLQDEALSPFSTQLSPLSVCSDPSSSVEPPPEKKTRVKKTNQLKGEITRLFTMLDTSPHTHTHTYLQCIVEDS